MAWTRKSSLPHSCLQRGEHRVELRVVFDIAGQHDVRSRCDAASGFSRLAWASP